MVPIHYIKFKKILHTLEDTKDTYPILLPVANDRLLYFYGVLILLILLVDEFFRSGMIFKGFDNMDWNTQFDTQRNIKLHTEE